ncbi:MAG: hypothetical protein PWR10_829 [Halanaerobiales bacterium]|nr:hypothetical protein [Halanaerobiales bacterium]
MDNAIINGQIADKPSPKKEKEIPVDIYPLLSKVRTSDNNEKKVKAMITLHSW